MLLVALVFSGCARALPPPGGEPDREPPRLVSTKPEQQAVVQGYEDKVVFTFDETLSERGARDAVLVSPETGRALLEHLLRVAEERGYRELLLETGSHPAFTPALTLYRSVGFRECGPFGDYVDNGFSVFMSLQLPNGGKRPSRT